MNDNQNIHGKVLRRIYTHGRGSIHSVTDFLQVGSRAAVDQTLSRLAEKGTIRRLARGLYEYPRTHPVLGPLAPNPNAIAETLAGRHDTRLQPSGAYAANLLGLTEQVPAKIVFLTDGATKTVQIGNQTIQLRRTTPRHMATAGRISGLVIQALRHLGAAHVDERVIGILRRRLSEEDKRQLLKDVPHAPAWIGALMRRVARSEP